MKKIFTLSLAIATGAAAFAVTPITKDLSSSANGESVQTVNMSRAHSTEAVRAQFSKEIPTAGERKNAPAVKAATSESNLLYYLPTSTYTSTITGEYSGTELIIPAMCFIPPYVDNVFYNATWYAEADGPTYVDNTGLTYNWTWGNNKSETAIDLTIANEPSMNAGYGITAPVLSSDGKTYQSGQQGSDQFEPNFLIFGGNGDANVLLDLYGQDGLTNAAVGGAYPFIFTADDFVNFGFGGAWIYAAKGQDKAEFEDTWSRDIQRAGIDNAQLKSFAQLLSFGGAPVALSYIKLNALVTCPANTVITMTMREITEDGYIGETIYTSDFTITESMTEGNVELEFPITSTDGIDEINYLVVNSDVMVEFTGFADLDLFALPTANFLYVNTDTQQEDEKYNMPSSESTIYACFSGTKNGESTATYIRSTTLSGWYNEDKTRVNFCQLTSFRMQVGMEYPYLQTIAYAHQDDAQYTNLEAKDEAVNITLDEGETAEIVALCPGEAADIVFTTADGGELPAWMIAEAYSAQEIEEEDQDQKYVYIALLNEGGNANIDVMATYKGQSQTFHITATGGINDVNTGAAEVIAREYFDLQGRKLNAAPEAGLYIERAVKADGSATTTKLAK